MLKCWCSIRRKEKTQQEFDILIHSVGLAISAIVLTEAVTSLIIAGKPTVASVL
jgi:hypothetical protein